MIIGHLPAGYISAKLFIKRFNVSDSESKWIFFSTILGSVISDFDMFYFFFIDAGQVHHHKYFTHWPVLWIFLLVFSLVLRAAKVGKPYIWTCAVLFSLMGLGHMVLDSIVGDIWWFAPWIDKPFSLFSVSPLYKPWWLNFIFHWSFLLEVSLIGWGIYLYRNKTSH